MIRTTSQKKSESKSYIVKALVVLVVLVLVYIFFSNPLVNLLHGTEKSVGHMLGYYSDPVRPIDENAYVKALEIENDQLKDVLGRTPDKDDRILSVILSRPPQTPYDSLIIDIGQDQDLSSGDLVYAESNYLIGYVDTVYSYSSAVKLFSSPDQKLNVLIGSSTVPVVAEGRGSGNFYIRVPENITVNVGDPIMVPSLDSIILGSAEKVESGQGDAYTYVYFKLPVMLNTLQYVQIKKTVH